LSNFAQGWAQRQQLGDPTAKAVLQAMCHLMSDEVLLAFPSITTLVELTEFDDRAVRRAMQRMAENGWLLDTGKRKNNVTVWRIPAYERWLTAQVASNPQMGRALDRDALARVQAHVSAGEKQKEEALPKEPSPNGEGSDKALPISRQALPIWSSSPPQMGSQSSLESPRSEDAPARASPAGARSAQKKPKTEPELPPYDEQQSRTYWRSLLANQVVCDCALFGIRGAKRGDTWNDLDHQMRAVMLGHINRLVDWAIDQERPPVPLKSKTLIEHHLRSELELEMRVYKPATVAERACAVA